MKKKTNNKVVRKTIFTIPSDEAREHLEKIIVDVNAIMKNDKFLEATKKVKLPDNATMKDFEKMVKTVMPNKVYNFLMLIGSDCYDNIRRILAEIFVTDFEEYRNKSIKEMCEDIASLNLNEMANIIGFFHL